MRASLLARIGQEQPHQTQAPHFRVDLRMLLTVVRTSSVAPSRRARQGDALAQRSPAKQGELVEGNF